MSLAKKKRAPTEGEEKAILVVYILGGKQNNPVPERFIEALWNVATLDELKVMASRMPR